jgi:hypothetical protein
VFNSPGDRSGNGGPDRGLSGRIRHVRTEIFRTGEDNSKTVSVPPHHLTIALLDIAQNNQTELVREVSGGSNFEERSRRREITDHAPNHTGSTELDLAGGKPALSYGAPVFAH